MVGLVNKFAAKLEEKKGSLTEDEVGIYCSYGDTMSEITTVHIDYPVQIVSSECGHCKSSYKVNTRGVICSVKQGEGLG